MKLLILGAGGMAGHVIAIKLSEYGHSVTGFARRELPFCKTIAGDAITTNILLEFTTYGLKTQKNG